MIQISFSAFSGKTTSARMVCDLKSTHLYQKNASDEDERGIKIPEKTDLNLYSNPAFSGMSEQKQDFLSKIFFQSKARKALFLKALSLCFYSNSMVATGFSEISHMTRLTPGTVLMIRSRMVQSTGKGISGMVAVTASTVLTARMITAQPM